MTVKEAVIKRIFELCDDKGISINALSHISGVTQSTLHNVISGRNKTVTVSTVQKLCDGLEITIEDFFHSPLFRGLEQEIK